MIITSQNDEIVVSLTYDENGNVIRSTQVNKEGLIISDQIIENQYNEENQLLLCEIFELTEGKKVPISFSEYYYENDILIREDILDLNSTLKGYYEYVYR